MEIPADHSMFEKRQAARSKWFKEWVPQDLVSKGGKCYLLKWVTEDTLRALKEKCKETETEETKPEPTTEVLFLCSYEGCGKTFIDPGAIKKHAHIHGERQYVCHYDGCGKKFLDSSKLKRHFLIHTGERDYICPHEGCGKAFSLDFNLRAHMRTHSQENYHVCPYPECEKRYTHECKLKAHVKTHHEKIMVVDTVKRPPPPAKHHNTLKVPAVILRDTDRPYACPYEGCGKAYIHEYKLNLHFRNQHPGHNTEENGRHAPTSDHAMDEASDQDGQTTKGGVGKNPKRSKPNPTQKMPPAKVPDRKGASVPPVNVNAAVKKRWPAEEMYEEDSEETEEDRGDGEEDGWRYRGENEDDDEETEDED